MMVAPVTTTSSPLALKVADCTLRLPLTLSELLTGWTVLVPLTRTSLKELLPLSTVCVPDPLKATTPVPGVNVPPVRDQLPATLIVGLPLTVYVPPAWL